MGDYWIVGSILVVTFVLLFFRLTYLKIFTKTAKKRFFHDLVFTKAPMWLDVLVITLVISYTAIVLYLMGRSPLCICGHFNLFAADIWSNENSQQVADPYTFTHITHGFLFYGLFFLIGKKLPLRVKLILAITLEAAWELLENTPMVIDRYRTATLAVTYYGDSILNSTFDIIACITGFFLASKLPTRISITGVIFMEVALAILIRDSLLLSTLMLLFPIESIKQWQTAIAPPQQ